ncbi:sensor histidine kinase [Bryocella elongata]|uniref:sensor histidine kinase n=1 Tax=Bryocella elongata TaxID=863522 RepID=UPI001F239925|nr:sensor histidine kinase [Bryocella elongata]
MLLAVGAVADAASPVRIQLSEYQKQDWQVEDGLPENDVRMIAQRPDGALLLATSSGIARFDGQRFQSLPIEVAGIVENEAVNAILPGDNGELWIGTDGRGILHHTPSGTVNISERAGFYNERIRMFYRDSKGVLWIATQNGVERFEGDHLEAVAGAGMISGDITTPFAEDGFGGMFFVTSSGLFHWQDGVVQRYKLHQPASDLAVAVYRDPQRRIWVGTMKHVLQLVPKREGNRETGQFEEIIRANVGAPVSVLLGDKDGNLWIGTRRDGMWRLSPDGLSRWNSKNGLPDDSIRALFLDDEQNLWIGMLTGGLSRWHKGALAPYGDAEGFHSVYSANVLADSRGDLWFGTWGKGLFRSHRGTLQSFVIPGMPATTPIRALAEDGKGQVWVGTWFNGVFRYDGRIFHHYLLGTESPGNAVSAILFSKAGGLWIGTYTGLFYFPSGEPNARDRSYLLQSLLVTCLIEDVDGSVLVGTSTGLYRIRDGKATAIMGLPHPYILSLTRDSSGYIWTATKAGGLDAVRGDHVEAVPSNAGLPNLYVNTAIEDNDGHLWLGTSRGILRVTLSELHSTVDGHRTHLSVVTLGKADGMRSSECGGPSKPTSARLPDGTLWFATTKGFVHTTDIAEQIGSVDSTATIVGWSPSTDADNSSIIPLGPNSQAVVDASQRDILLFFNAKLLSNPSQIEFRYRLSGYDAEWTYTHARVARYRHLPPGSYHFEVQARRSGQEWSSPIASLVLKQRPYFYQTWYFYLSLAVVALGVIVHLFRRRVQLIKGRIGIVLEERSRIARECHDTLMAGFAAISWQLEATSKLFLDSHSESTPAAESCELARSMVAHCQAEARRIIWDLRDSDEVTNVLSQALARTLSANIAGPGIETTFDVEGEELPLAPGCVHHLVCIGQEAVSNAIRHARASRIMIHLKYDEDALCLSICDNGCGFHHLERAASVRGHFGIPVMKERARKIGGTLRLQTSAGAGTEVTVKVSFNALPQPISQQNVIRWIGI